MRGAVRGALDNADVPFSMVVADAAVPRSAAYSPLFQNLCVLQGRRVGRPASAGRHHLAGPAGALTQTLLGLGVMPASVDYRIYCLQAMRLHNCGVVWC